MTATLPKVCNGDAGGEGDLAAERILDVTGVEAVYRVEGLDCLGVLEDLDLDVLSGVVQCFQSLKALLGLVQLRGLVLLGLVVGVGGQCLLFSLCLRCHFPLLKTHQPLQLARADAS